MKIDKSSKGITLIALIITVIVLVILAGTAIGIAINGGDIFGKASEAREAWNVAVENENKTLKDLVSYLIPGKPTGIIKSSFLTNGNNSKIGVKATGGNAYKYKLSTSDTWSEAVLDGIEYEFTGLAENQTYTIQAICTDSLGDGTEIAEAQMKAEYEGNIGKYVHYPVSLGIGSTSGDNEFDDDWVVFYEDEEDGITYLIAASYVRSEFITNVTSSNSGRAGLCKSTNSDYIYNVLWNDPPSMSVSISSNRMTEKFIHISNMDRYYPRFEKHICSFLLLDNDAWSSFILKKPNSNEYYDSSIEAVGAPTIELWVKSWNQRNYDELKCKYEQSNFYYGGYQIGVGENLSDINTNSYNVTNLAINGYSNKVYFPFNQKVNGCDGYYLASPNSLNNNSYIGKVLNNGSVTDSSVYYDGNCVRPVVSMNTSLIAPDKTTADENNMAIYYTGGNVND